MITISFVAACLLKASIVVAIASCLTLALRRSSASLRHAVWLATILSLLFLPLAEVGLPHWNIFKASLGRPANTEQLKIDHRRALETNRDTLHSAFDSTKTRQQEGAIASTVTEHEPQNDVTLVKPSALVNPPKPLGLGLVIGAVWLIGSFCVGGWIVIGLVRVRYLIRVANPFSSELILSSVPVLVSEQLSIPSTAGILHPVILLPPQAREWNEAKLRMVVDHEMGHISRKDWLWQLFAQLTCAVHFLNPLVWWAAKQLRLQSELACDDLVLMKGVPAAEYASTLLSVVRLARYSSAYLVEMAGRSTVEGRLRAILDTSRARKSASGFALGALLVGIFCITLPVAALHGQAPSSKLIGQDKNAPQQDETRYPQEFHSHINQEPTTVLSDMSLRERLPHVPTISSRRIANNVYLAENGLAALPGFRVRLVGIGNENGTQLWDLNSQNLPSKGICGAGGRRLLKKGSYLVEDPHQIISNDTVLSDSHMNRMCLLEIESDKDAEVLIRANTKGAKDTGFAEVLGTQTDNPVRLYPNDPSYGNFAVSLEADYPQAPFEFGIAGPSWRTDGTIMIAKSRFSKKMKNLHFDSVRIVLGTSPALVCCFKEKELNKPWPLLKNPIPAGRAVRVSFYDKNGKTLEVSGRFNEYQSGSGSTAGAVLSWDELIQVAKIKIQSSPYVWAEFRNVPFRLEQIWNPVASFALENDSLPDGRRSPVGIVLGNGYVMTENYSAQQKKYQLRCLYPSVPSNAHKALLEQRLVAHLKDGRTEELVMQPVTNGRVQSGSRGQRGFWQGNKFVAAQANSLRELEDGLANTAQNIQICHLVPAQGQGVGANPSIAEISEVLYQTRLLAGVNAKK